MAESPSHRFGQQVGMMIEAVVEPILKDFCVKRKLELDSKNGRLVGGKGRKVIWLDRFGNAHDLDYVVVRPSQHGSSGSPLAFIEVAWRRYTKHSRNKAQEIQGALLPIAERYAHDRPFLGAVLAGVFTEPSLAQMRSCGFNILYFPYDSIVGAYREANLDVRFDEGTPDATFATTVKRIDALSGRLKERVLRSLTRQNRRSIDTFVESLRRSIDRRPTRVVIVPLFGRDHEFASIMKAIEFVKAFKRKQAGPFRKFDVIVSFSNDDRIEGIFASADEVVRFLRYVG